MSENYASDRVTEVLDPLDTDGNGGGIDGRKDENVVAEGNRDLGFSSNDDGVVVVDAGRAGSGMVPVFTEEESNSIVESDSNVDSSLDAQQFTGEIEVVTPEGVMVNHAENGSYGVNVKQINVEEMPISGVQVDDRAGHVENGVFLEQDSSVPDDDNPVDGNLYEDANKEETFEDAPDQLITFDGRGPTVGDSMVVDETWKVLEKNIHIEEVEDGEQLVHQLKDELAMVQAELDRTIAEKEIMANECNEYKGEREVLSRELIDLYHQLHILSNQQLCKESSDRTISCVHCAEKGESGDNTLVSITPLHAIVDGCSKCILFLKNALEEQLESEGTMRELHASLFKKDQEIEDLNAEVSEISLTHDVVVSYMVSLQKMLFESLKEFSDARLEGEMHLEALTNRLLSSLASVVQQDDMLDYSLKDRSAFLEKKTAFMVQNYMKFVSEINHLGQCLADFTSDFTIPQDKDSDVVFGIAREKLIECRKKELDLVEKVNKLEADNHKLFAELEKTKGSLDEANIVSSKTNTELEQAESKLAAAKEKLSMAVTKGKALVQQRDSLRKSLSEKTNELEDCLLELQQKSSALEAAEACNLELAQNQNLVVSLQESLTQRNMALQEMEEVISQINLPVEIHSMDIIDKIKWVVNQKGILEDVFQENCKLKDALSSIDLPEAVSSTAFVSQVEWLGSSFAQSKNDLFKLQEELVSTHEAVASNELELSEARKAIEELTASLLVEHEEKDSLQARLEEINSKYEAMVEKVSLVSSEKDGLMRMLLEVSGSKMEDQVVDEASLDTRFFIEKCIENIKGRIDASEDNVIKLQEQLSHTREAMAAHALELSDARNEIDQLTASLSAERQENYSLQLKLEELKSKYGEAVEKASLESSEKVKLMGLLVEVSDSSMKDQEIDEASPDTGTLIDKCIEKIREKICSSESSLDGEQFQRLQSLLFMTNQELNLCEKMLEEEMIDRVEMLNLSDELRRVSEEVVALKKERDSLQKDLERSEEKSFLIREKLSLAVKKGKGLVQEREGFKVSLDQKKAEIERLKHELEQQESVVTEYKDRVQVLTSDLECIPKLESDVIATKSQRDQFEESLLESNNMLQRVIGSIESIVLPINVDFKEPVEKVKWLSEHIQELQMGKTNIEQELLNLKEEAVVLVSRLTDAHSTIKYLEEALSQAEKHVAVLGDEKKDAEAWKSWASQELEKAKEKTILQGTKLAEAYETIRSLEDALSEAENSISILNEEKKDAQDGKTRAVEELKNIKEDAGFHSGELADAYATIKSLEDALSQAEKTISMLSDEKKDAQIGKASVEQELQKVQAEAVSLVSRHANSLATIKSLEDALSHEENRISVLTDEMQESETKSKEEIVTLNAKLAACTEELAGTQHRLENQSSELVGHLNHLQMLLKGESLLSLLTKEFEKKFEGLRNMGLILQNIRDQVAGEGSKWTHNIHDLQIDPHVEMLLASPEVENYPNGTFTIDSGDGISSYFSKIVEWFNMQNSLVDDKFQRFSSSMDKHIAALLEVLQTIREEVIGMHERLASLELNVNNFEDSSMTQDNKISILQNDITVLLSACTDATEELQNVLHSRMLDPEIHSELASLNSSIYLTSEEDDGCPVIETSGKIGADDPVKMAKCLSLAARRVRAQSERLQRVQGVWAETIKELQLELKEAKISSEKAIQERDVNLNKTSKLEGDLEALETRCNELKLKLEDYEVSADKLREKEAELSSLYHTLAEKDQVSDQCILSRSQVEKLFIEVNKLEIHPKESELDSLESNFSGPLDKLFYIIDNFAELQLGMTSLIRDNEELQLNIAAQVCEIENLKKEAEISVSSHHNLEKKNYDLAEVTLGVEKIIQKLGGNDIVEDKKSANELLLVLEKLVLAITLECESHKSKSLELGSKLLGNQKVVDELSAKVKFLEDSLHERPAMTDKVQERSIPSSLEGASEISEIEDVGSLGKNSLAPVPAAAHARTMRKGSSDHLVLNIDSETDRLINHNETDDKGHVFKSLNTSGLIPKQGKLIADRIDGIWVSGGRILMGRPGARIGLIAYWLLLHIWVLGTIL